MKRTILFALMIPLLLTGCAGRAETEWSLWQASLTGREITFSAEITVSAGETRQTFRGTAADDGETCVFTVTSPESIAGVTCRCTAGEDTLEYDGAILSLGTAEEDSAAPCAACPILTDALRRGRLLYLGREPNCTTAALEGKNGETVTLWRREGIPVYAEIARDGRTTLRLGLENWSTKEKE